MIKAKTGPKPKVDIEKLETMARYGLTNLEIASLMDVTHECLSKNEEYRRIIERGRTDLNLRLKQKAYKMALEGDGHYQMLKFCLSHYCGWSDKVTNTLKAADDGKPVFNIVFEEPKT